MISFLYVTYITEFILGGPDSQSIHTTYPRPFHTPYIIRIIVGILYLRCVNIGHYTVQCGQKPVSGPVCVYQAQDVYDAMSITDCIVPAAGHAVAQLV